MMSISMSTKLRLAGSEDVRYISAASKLNWRLVELHFGSSLTPGENNVKVARLKSDERGKEVAAQK
jgi:hypothetical protein